MGFFIFLIVCAGAFFFYKSAKETQEQWRTAADRLNLAYQPGSLGAVGTILGWNNGHQLSVSTFSNGNGQSSSTYTRYRVDYRNPLPFDLMIRRQGLLQGIGKVFGTQDIEVGNPEFDSQLLVQGSSPVKVRAFLVKNIQDDICDLALTYKDLTITSSYIEVNKAGKDRDAARMVKAMQRLAGFCEAMMGASGTYPAETEKSGPEDASSDPPAYDIEPPPVPFNPLWSANPVVPEPPLIPVPPDDPDYVAEEEPEEDLSMVAEPVEEEAEPPDVPEYIAGEKPEEDLSMVAEPVEEETEPPVEAGSLLEAAHALFGDDGNSMAASKQFDERFKGHPVAGSGELMRISKFTYDPVFTQRDGVTATVSICELPGTYSTLKVVAEVRYPADRYAELESKIGATIPVSGRMVGLDSLMNRLFIEVD